MNSESVDLIYLDPPFNSNANYAAPIGSKAAGAAFKDTWTLDDVDEAWHGEIADRQPALYAIIDAAGLAHGKGMKSYLIMMAVRLLEMRRLLKPTGSIYLHCDPTASHYLKTLMDAIFGRKNFRNEIVWKRRQDTHNLASKTMGAAHDAILWYGDYDRSVYRRQFTPCTNEAGGNTRYEFRGLVRAWRFSAETMRRMFDDDRLVRLTDDGPFYYKKYLADAEGVPVQDIWVDVPPAKGRESIGYPTQKPLALLERVIKASSDPGDVVLDPFCGCATTLVAADRLDREWAGIDLSPIAARLVLRRIRKDRGPLFDDVHHRTDVPARTDFGGLPNYRTHRHTLYGRQEGVCGGCQVLFPFRNMTVDHMVPRAKGGQDNIENLQLLCAACNSMKGARPQEEGR